LLVRTRIERAQRHKRWRNALYIITAAKTVPYVCLKLLDAIVQQRKRWALAARRCTRWCGMDRHALAFSCS